MSDNPSLTMLDLKRQYKSLQKEIDAAIARCLAHQHWILGPEVAQFEGAVAQFLHATHCIGASSGTEALVLALRALALTRFGTEYFTREQYVICPALSFTATGDSILRAGATPLFVDIDPETYALDAAQVAAACNSYANIVGMIPVHLYGHAAQMIELQNIALDHRLFIVEDVAQAFGGSYQGKMLGAIGDLGCHSFFPSKNLGGYGDAGMVSTNNGELAEMVRMLLKHGGKDKYNVDHIGYNARIDTLQAAILLAKLPYVAKSNESRRSHAAYYQKALSEVSGIILPSERAPARHVYHQFTIRVLGGRRAELINALKAQGIESMVYYPVPLSNMKVFEGRSARHGDLSHAVRACSEVVSLPIEPLYGTGELDRVVSGVKSFFV